MNFTSSYNSLCKNNANGREHTKKQALYYFVFRHNVQVHKNKIKKRKCSYEGNMNQHNECQVQNTTFSLMSLFMFGKWMWAQHGFSVWLLSGGWTFFFQFLLVVLSVRAGGGIYFKSCFRCLKDSVLFCADILPQLPLLWDNAGGFHLFVGGRLSSLRLKNRVFALHTHSWRNV